MPHKRNPVLAENLTGLARIVRSAVVPALENVALWHERDISHSSVERVIAPDTTIALDFALARLAGLVDRLVVYPERMRAEPRLAGRPRQLAAGAAGADPGRHEPRGRLPRGPAERDGRLGRPGPLPRPAESRIPKSPAISTPQAIDGSFDTRLPPQTRRHDLRPRVRGGSGLLGSRDHTFGGGGAVNWARSA